MTETTTTTEVSPEVQEQLEQLAHIRRCERALQRRRNEEKEAKSEYDAAKKQTEVAQDRLNRASGPDEELELFETASGPGENRDPDAWRGVPISELGIADGTATILEERAGLKTLGQLVDYQGDGETDLSSISGIGESKAEGIRDALARWWEGHPELNPEQPQVLADGMFRAQCGYEAPRSEFAFSDDGKEYLCPHCDVTFRVHEEGALMDAPTLTGESGDNDND